MSTPNFRFKQFTVWHDRCAMKVGTDGVLLGAWVFSKSSRDNHEPISNQLRANYERLSCLDIGTGSGLIALMMAQQCPDAHVDAIDIDPAAVEQATENFRLSPFSHQLAAYQARLQEWEPDTKYDWIVSNPPYFQNSLKNPDEGLKLARHTDSLSYEELITHSARLLSENGHLALILPAEAEAEVRALAATKDLFLARITRVRSKEMKPVRRILMDFELSRSHDHIITVVEDSLVLENEIGGRSAAYSELCKEFYL